MRIYLLRHGIAEDGEPGRPDSERALTAEGKRRVRDVLRTVAGAGVTVGLILSSPYRRAVETARIAAEELGYTGQVLLTAALTPGSSPQQAWEEIRVHGDRGPILLAGHEPLFSQLGAYLLGTPETSIDFKKGALLAIELDAKGARPRGTLKWMLTPKLT